jgi:glycosyltransferase involved in cell wall biosynthesis
MVNITIITVVFNRVNTIEKTIKSVLNQSYNFIDYIIIDGNSNDGTIKIINKYQNKLKHFISEKDNGIYDAMNKGLNLVQNDEQFILFLNADDYLIDNHIISNFVSSYSGADFIYGKVKYVNENKYVINGQQESFESLYKGMIQHQATFCKKIVFNTLGHFDTNYKITADYNLAIKILKSNFKTSYYNNIISVMKMGGVSSSQSFKMHLEKLSVIKNHYNTTILLRYLFFIFLIDILKSILYSFFYSKRS